jgi:hypothetical protein
MKHKFLVTVAATLAGAAALALAAQAAETDYKFTWCGLDKSAMLSSGPDLTIFTDEARGMVTPESGFKPFENTAVRCMGYHRMMQGKEWGHSACLMTDAQGDTLIGEATIAPDKPPVWTFLAGTGKWQGITGSGTFQFTAMTKPGADGTMEFCLTPTGKYALPK